MEYRIKYSDAYLEHHGIKGQKWGKQNGPPYPLDYDDHSKEEKKKNNKNDLDNYSDNITLENKNILRPTPEEIQARRQANKELLITAAYAVGIGAACYVVYKRSSIDYIANGLEKAKELGIKLDDDGLRSLTKDALDASVKDVDWVIKQDDVMHRMHAWKDFDLNRTEGKGTYVTVTEADRSAYMVFLKDWHKTGERYDVSLTAKNDINVPSETHARQLFEKFYKDNPEYQKKLFDTIAGAYEKIYRESGIGSGTSKMLAKSTAARDIKQDVFKSGIYSIVKGKDDARMLFQMYRQAGYGAIVDYFDKGTLGELPVILFDAKQDTVVSGSKYVTEAMKSEAYRTLRTSVSHPMHKYV